MVSDVVCLIIFGIASVHKTPEKNRLQKGFTDGSPYEVLKT